MTKDEALKMAIDSLEMAHDLQLTGILSFKKYKLNCDADLIKKLEKTLNACKEALEQPAQEPVAWTDEYKMYLEWDKESLCDKAVCKEHKAIALYTHPAQPLDIEILNSLYDMAEERDGDAFDFDHIKFARAIEKAHGIAVNDG